MKTSRIRSRVHLGLSLLVLLLQPSLTLATTSEPPPGAAAAALENQAATLESRIDKECQKVARQARPLCRQQHAQAVQRLRTQAARKR